MKIVQLVGEQKWNWKDIAARVGKGTETCRAHWTKNLQSHFQNVKYNPKGKKQPGVQKIDFGKK